MTMSSTYTEAVLKKLTKPELIDLLIKTEATQGTKITNLSKGVKDTLAHLKVLEADITILSTVNKRFVEKLVKTKRQCWKNVQFSRWDIQEIVGIPNGMFKSVLAWKKREGIESNLWTWKICQGRFFTKSLWWRRKLNPLTWQSWNFLGIPKSLLMKVYVLIIETFVINAQI